MVATSQKLHTRSIASSTMPAARDRGNVAITLRAEPSMAKPTAPSRQRIAPAMSAAICNEK
ncbi:MAG: hypothetical protein DMF13_04580 [Verrucomicrobia bacterium]|nr:MAG: hypothetical protein DMF13_04580 [Verrucomicrobiota bacterium]